MCDDGLEYNKVNLLELIENKSDFYLQQQKRIFKKRIEISLETLKNADIKNCGSSSETISVNNGIKSNIRSIVHHTDLE